MVIGFLMLMGIVAKNSILLVDFAIEEMRAGKPRAEALLEAGHKRARPDRHDHRGHDRRHDSGGAAAAERRSSSARPWPSRSSAGLITSTALTLVIVPAVFTLVDDVEQWLGPRVARLLHADTARATRASAEPPQTRPHAVSYVSAPGGDFAACCRSNP